MLLTIRIVFANPVPGNEEKKALAYIEKLQAVVELNDLKGMVLAGELANEIDFVNVRPEILKRIDKLYNHPNYSDAD